MKFQLAISAGVPDSVFRELSSPSFALALLDNVIGDIFEVDDPLGRPAEYCVELPGGTSQVAPDVFGVQGRLIDVSRGNREPKVFHKALEQFELIVLEAIQRGLNGLEDSGLRVQAFVAIMIDGDVAVSPAAEAPAHESIHESVAKWVTADGVEPLE